MTKFREKRNLNCEFTELKDDSVIRAELWVRKFIYGNRYFQLAYLKRWPYENRCFAFISDRYTFKLTEPVYESEVQTRTWNVNL